MMLRTLGRSGLLVSPLCLGTMTFGNRNWGSTDDVAQAILRRFLDAGGNFIDTADVYSAHASEALLGRFIAEGKLRDRVVLATKSTFNTDGANPLAGGNGRKHLTRSVERSLGFLQTDYIDLYWMHAWDTITPVEEVLESLGNLVRAGKILYFGFSDAPAWYATRAATLAEAHGLPAPVAIQPEYSLTERTIEYEHVPAARVCGLGICSWSPLAGGFLTGKYARDASGNSSPGGGRLDRTDQPYRKFTDRNWQILATLREVASQVGRPPAQVALAWVAAQAGITAPIIGATKLEQLNDNLAALEITLTPTQLARLNEASAPPSVPPYSIFTGDTPNRVFFGGASIRRD